MKNLETNAIKTLINIIGTVPEYQIVHFTDGGEPLIDAIQAHCTQHDYLYQINCLDDDLHQTLQEKYKEIKKTVVLKIPLERRTYKIQAREYQFMFVTASIAEEERGEFLKKAHVIIRSSGNIIIFIKKKDYKERDSWTSLLEENLYVSTSIIDDMFENYDVIISKRMHGWGV